MKTVCFFGIYNRQYPRNRNIIKSLKSLGYCVIECHTSKRGIAKYFDLIRKHQKVKNSYDILWVGFNGFAVVWLAKILTYKKVVFDAFSSLYVSDILDRKKVSFLGRAKIFLMEWISYRLADVVVFDTEAQIDYVVCKFKADKCKFIAVPPLPDRDIYTCREGAEQERYIVHWHGKVLPFHGLDVILESASILSGEDIEYQIVVDNKNYDKVLERVKEYKLENVKVKRYVSYGKLSHLICRANVALGVFGEGIKIDLVVPNKIYECIACKMPVITARSKAIIDIFKSDEIVYVERGRPQELSDKILYLKENHRISKQIADKAFHKLQSLYEIYNLNIEKICGKKD